MHVSVSMSLWGISVEQLSQHTPLGGTSSYFGPVRFCVSIGDMKVPILEVWFNELTMCQRKFLLGLWRRPACHALSNACATSRNKPQQCFLSSSAIEALLATPRPCSTVACWRLNPNWKVGMTCFSQRMGSIWARSSFSNSLLTIGSKAIGR